MNKGDAIGIFFLAVLFASVGAFFSWITTSEGYDRHWKAEAVKHGAAEYDSVTGDWMWKELKAKEDGHGG